ncbi:MAG: hypothetical protein WBO10_02080 [Pyrinomonadaceae bacterium]
MKHKSLTKPASALFTVALLTLLSLGSARSQEVTVVKDNTNTTSSDQTVDPPKDYEVQSSIELGVRGRSLDGSESKYRSDLNYRSGFRFFDSSLLVTANKSAGKPFDTLLIMGSGWSADPNGYAKVSMEKLGLYRFDSSIRRISYFNSLDNFALNEHRRNTKRNLGDFDVTFLPLNERIRFRLGYSYNKQDGPGMMTYDYDRDEFTIDSATKSKADDFRFGVESNIGGFHLTFDEAFRRFDDDTSYSVTSLNLGANTSPNSSISSLSRLIPERGRIYDHRFTAHRSLGNRADFTGRLIYSVSKSSFSMLETITGTDRSGNPIVSDISNVDGNAKRPNFIGDANFTVNVTDRFRISNSFSSNSYRITGGNILLQALTRTNIAGVPLPVVVTNTSAYRYTNYRRYMNTLEGDYDLNRYFSFYLGYRYSNRKVLLDLLDINLANQTPSFHTDEGENVAHSVIAGFKASPIPKKWTLYFDIDKGTSDNAFTRLSNYNSTNLKVRSITRPTNELTFNLSFQVKNNDNPSRTDTTPVTSFRADVKSSFVAASLDWRPTETFSLNGGFTHNRVTSETDVIFPSTPPGGTGQGISRYFLRNNFFNLDGWFHPNRRVTFFASYRIARDNSRGDIYDATTRLIEGSYPLSFQSPEARLTLKLTKNIDWNVGYQYYKYDELVRQTQNYSAHLPYTSLRIYFGKGIEDR